MIRQRQREGIALGSRYALEVDCWSPLTWRQGLARAEAWLATHADSAPAADVGAVGSIHGWLTERTAAQAAIVAREHSLRWLPMIAIALFAALVAVLARGAFLR